MSPQRIHRACCVAVVATLLLLPAAAPAQAGPGDLDPDFGRGGVVLHDFGEYAEANGIAVQRNGRIVVAGETFRNDPVSSDRVFVARFRKNGKLDHSFAADGKRIVDLPDNRDRAAGVVISQSGRISIGVGTGRIDQQSADESFRAGVLRLRPDGSLARGFGEKGLALVGRGIPEELEMASDGDLVLASAFTEDERCCHYGVTRINANGTPDTRFSDDGFEPKLSLSETGTDENRIGFAVDGPRTYLTDSVDPNRVLVIALDRRGDPDEEFDGPGRRAGFGSYDLSASGSVNSADVDATDRLIVGVDFAGSNAGALRVLPSGQADSDFGPDGLSAGQFAAQGAAEVIAEAARTVLVGGGAVLATRGILANGQNDPAWGEAGVTEDRAGRESVIVTGSGGPNGVVVVGSAEKRHGGRTLVLIGRYQD